MKTRSLTIIVAFAALTMLAGCGSPNEFSGNGPGFWIGLFDGWTAVLCFLGNLLGLGDWGVYEIHNSGAWYDLGFLIGLGGLGKVFSLGFSRGD